MQMYVVLVRSFGLVNKYWPLWWCLDLSITYLCPNYFSGTRLATFMRKLHQIYQMLWDDTVYRWPFIIESMFFFLTVVYKGINCKHRLPCPRHAIIADSIGFIQHLPHSLFAAFQATLEARGCERFISGYVQLFGYQNRWFGKGSSLQIMVGFRYLC